jgi:hypothetical protein
MPVLRVAGYWCRMSNINLSDESTTTILTVLEQEERDCIWEMECLPIQQKENKSDAYIYWTNKHAAIYKALKEFKRAI